MTCNLPWPGLVANNSQDIANAAVKLYKESIAWQTASELAPKCAELLFVQDRHFELFAKCLASISADLTVHRQQNFIGSMLNHHHHKSTKYMAQWIEAKNR